MIALVLLLVVVVAAGSAGTPVIPLPDSDAPGSVFETVESLREVIGGGSCRSAPTCSRSPVTCSGGLKQESGILNADGPGGVGGDGFRERDRRMGCTFPLNSGPGIRLHLAHRYRSLFSGVVTRCRSVKYIIWKNNFSA